MSSRQIRATVVIKQQDPPETGGYATASAHENEIESGTLGITITWDAWNSMLIPWTSIIKIDYSKCHCTECVAADAKEQTA